ncbi:response regulator [Alkalihalobacillus hemicellulosilyticus]|uniref:Two-component response regulator n=1 Tax=Halalkalibacter hemicellulosilyticusJCM 9152 TaxID=1236971 RepID=W4QDQ2_9BACI|nr:response regulator [Halalkalibacter hemicellulosilyticus]GAE29813.1 two-component response regulator [Halalkalibacter hemicellulosilyticusJCM 9152]
MMLKAVICDDEYIVLEGLKKMIKWEKYNIELVGMAHDGIEALSLIEETQPDIVFTDIRMPGMDGLRLIERITEQFPMVICIVFSGFTEFTYLKQAIKLGVIDYIEKPVTIEKIEDAITRTMKRYNEQKELKQLKVEQFETHEERLKKQTLDLLHGQRPATANWTRLLPFSIEDVRGMLILAYDGTSQSFLEDDHCKYLSLTEGARQILVVFLYKEMNAMLWDSLFSWAESIGLTVGCGSVAPTPSELSTSYVQAIKALKHGRYFKETGFIRSEDIGQYDTLPADFSKQEKKLIDCFRREQFDVFLQELNEYFNTHHSTILDPDVSKGTFIKLYYYIIDETKAMLGDLSTANLHLPHIEIQRFDSMDELITWLTSQFHELIAQAQKMKKQTRHSAIDTAIAHIKQHFDKDLTLQQVAEMVDMNPTYFSFLFKEETGESYIKYVTKHRIERAKERLIQGETVADVSARVGYHTPRHFSSVFKKHTGISPGKYKDGE